MGGAEEVIVRGFKIGSPERKLVRTQYGPGLRKEVTTVAEKAPVTAAVVVSTGPEAIAPPGHAPDERIVATKAPPVGKVSQVSVPLTVMLEVPCVMVDDHEGTPVWVHGGAYAGGRKVVPIIVSTRIERITKAIILNL
jgi:hypothetical protein